MNKVWPVVNTGLWWCNGGLLVGLRGPVVFTGHAELNQYVVFRCLVVTVTGRFCYRTSIATTWHYQSIPKLTRSVTTIVGADLHRSGCIYAGYTHASLGSRLTEQFYTPTVRATPSASPPFATRTLLFAVFACRFAPGWLWSEPAPMQPPLPLFGDPSFTSPPLIPVFAPCDSHCVHFSAT
jgi:hypothetical protein